MGEGLDVTLDGSAVHACRWTQDGWLDASVQFIRKIDFVLDCLQIEEPIRPIKQYQKHRPIKTNRPTDRGWLIGKAESVCEKVTENDGSARPTFLARAETSWEAIDQTITITTNIADGIGWVPESTRGLDQGLEVWNRSGTSSRPRKPDTQKVNVGR